MGEGRIRKQGKETVKTTRVYLAHPIRGDTVANLAKIRRLYGHLTRNCPDIIPLAPYLLTYDYLDDARPGETERGFAINKAYFEKGMIDEVWVCGGISSGVFTEMRWADVHGIPVVRMEEWAKRVLEGAL